MIQIVDVLLYRCSVVFLIGTTKEEWKKFFEKEKPKVTEADYVNVIDELDSGSLGALLGTEGGDYICYISDPTNQGLCVHEIFHAAHSILWDRLYRGDEGSEPTAYLIEFLYNQFLAILNNRKNRKK